MMLFVDLVQRGITRLAFVHSERATRIEFASVFRWGLESFRLIWDARDHPCFSQ